MSSQLKIAALYYESSRLGVFDWRTVHWLERIEDKNHPTVLLKLGQVYARSKKDGGKTSDQYYKKANALGYHSQASSLRLARIHYEGDGVSRDLSLSVKYYRKYFLMLEGKLDGRYKKSYEDFVKLLIDVGGGENIAESIKLMNKEMKARSIKISSAIKGAEDQFRYLYKGGYQAKRVAIIEEKRKKEIQALIRKTGNVPLNYEGLLVNFTKKYDAIKMMESTIKSELAIVHLFSKVVEKTYLSPSDDIEIVCFNYRSKFSTSNTEDCLLFEKKILVGFKLDHSQYGCPTTCSWAFYEVRELSKNFVKVFDERNDNTHRVQWARKNQKLNTLTWGAFTTKRYRMVGNVRHIDGYSYGVQATICVFPDKLEKLLKALKANRNNYTCT